MRLSSHESDLKRDIIAVGLGIVTAIGITSCSKTVSAEHTPKPTVSASATPTTHGSPEATQSPTESSPTPTPTPTESKPTSPTNPNSPLTASQLEFIKQATGLCDNEPTNKIVDTFTMSKANCVSEFQKSDFPTTDPEDTYAGINWGISPDNNGFSLNPSGDNRAQVIIKRTSHPVYLDKNNPRPNDEIINGLPCYFHPAGQRSPDYYNPGEYLTCSADPQNPQPFMYEIDVSMSDSFAAPKDQLIALMKSVIEFENNHPVS